MAKPRHRRHPHPSLSRRKSRGESIPMADDGGVVVTHRRGRSQWIYLPVDLLLLILEKINNLADHARFASVCSRWRSVAVEKPPINKPLYFALSHDPENLVCRFITSFIPNSWKKAKFIGALDGWLVILIDRKDLFLLNRALNSIIPLPPPPPLQHLNFSDRRDICKAVLSSPPSSSSSSIECTVVIKQHEVGLFYCSLGSDKSFTKFYETSDYICDILFYKGRLYVLCRPNTIIIFDHLLNKVSQSQWLSYYAYNPSTPWRLLISENNILSIVAGLPHHYSVFTFIFTLEEGSKPRVVRVNNIVEDNNFQILLSNGYCSLSITTKDHTDFQRYSNCFNIPFNSTIVIDTSEQDSNKAKLDDPWPLFFIMFSNYEIKKSGPKKKKKGREKC